MQEADELHPRTVTARYQLCLKQTQEEYAQLEMRKFRSKALEVRSGEKKNSQGLRLTSCDPDHPGKRHPSFSLSLMNSSSWLSSRHYQQWLSPLIVLMFMDAQSSNANFIAVRLFTVISKVVSTAPGRESL